MHVTAGNIITHLYYAVAADGRLLILSNFNEDFMSVAGLCANIGLGTESVAIIENGKYIETFPPAAEVDNYQVKIQNGRECLYQGVSLSRLISREYLFIEKKNWEEQLYAYLMNQFEFPILRRWIPYVTEEAMAKKLLHISEMKVIGETGLFDGYEIWHSEMTNEALLSILQAGLSDKKIHISEQEQRPLDFSDMDDYFNKYGHTLVDNLERLLRPLTSMKDKVEELTFIGKSLYPQQAAVVNGAVECLKKKKYAFLIESMGAGKTLQGLGVAEAFFNQEYLRKHSEKTVKEVYTDGRLIKFRVIIMCPAHLVHKWEEFIYEESPYAKVEIIEKLSQLTALRKKGKTPAGKEYYIVGKDTGKLSYAYMPTPTQIKVKKPKVPVCSHCEKEFPADLRSSCGCGCRKWELMEQREAVKGMICPKCGEILLAADGSGSIDETTGEYRVLMPENFAQQNSANRFCRCCGEILWMPACEPVDNRIMYWKPKEKPKKWKKISHYANRAMKGRKSVWVMKGREMLYKELNQLTDEEIEEMDIYGPRRFGLTRYIKKYLAGYFDLAIFDEVQSYKAGGSAQGYAMHDLIKASRKQLALTGTIAGGYASDLFYTLFRLDPGRMRAKGYRYSSAGERRFVEKYGTVETVYEIKEGGEYHSMSRGRVITPQRCLPGISVLIFTEFLLDTSLFLDLSDLSRYLPKLYEDVVIVPLESRIYEEYCRVRACMKEEMKERSGKLIMGSFLQFSFSYTDMPYNRGPILSPATGEMIVEPEDLSCLIEEGKLLNKEQKLKEIVSRELGEGRNCFIYCEYTGERESSISYRLKDVLEQTCGLCGYEVVVIESAYPAAVKREEWMHQKAAEGARVFITNAKCVSTGLDFAFVYQGKKYNYPTIIFYQLGYDMITIWQSSRRHYRLNQTEECRTYYLVSERTIQVDAVELVATKEVATSSIQGHFSAEGLYTMARGIDPRVILAQSVADKSEKKEQGLRKMMDVLNERNNQGRETASYKKMMVFSELTGLSEVPVLDDPFGEYEAATGRDILDLVFAFDNHNAEEPEDITPVQEETVDSEEPEDTELKELLELLFF